MSRKEDTIVAYNKGYRVINGEVISPFSGKARKLSIQTHKHSDYKRARFTIGGEHSYVKGVVNVHQLVAYQKFGPSMFEEGIVVRHLDGNSLNNRDENIAIGTQSDNEMDKLPEDRLAQSIRAATKLRKFTDKEMEDIKEFHNGSYKETMETFNISSKATLHRILNCKYQTKVC